MPNYPVNALFSQTELPQSNQLRSLYYYARNQAYAKPQQSYLTQLSPKEEASFQNWVKAANVPFDPSPTADYDMRGFWKGLVTDDPEARSGINPNDHELHYSDKWKTPYHASFSNESQWALPGAPSWINDHQLALPNGQVVYDEQAK